MYLWQVTFRRGQHYLTKHKLREALKCFYTALEDCPVDQGRPLSALLYYMGMTLRRLGCFDTAARTWLTLQQLKKSKYPLKMVKRFINGYGMQRMSNEILDDWKAFYTIQVTRYLMLKRRKQFDGRGEQDMLYDLIGEHFKCLKKEGRLENKSPEEKKQLFKSVKIIFPTLFGALPEGNSYSLASSSSKPEPVIPVNFIQKKRLSATDRCMCGSGAPYHACCGRIPGVNEHLAGYI